MRSHGLALNVKFTGSAMVIKFISKVYILGCSAPLGNRRSTTKIHGLKMVRQCQT